MTADSPDAGEHEQISFHVDGWAALGPGWNVVEVEGAVDALIHHGQKLAQIPPPNSAANRAVRNHEAVHAFNGPQELKYGEISYMLEEIRTNAVARHAGMDTQRYHDELVLDPTEKADRRIAALRWMQTVTSACSLESAAAGDPQVRADCPRLLRDYWIATNAFLSDADRAALAAATAAMMASRDPATREILAGRLAEVFPEMTGEAPVKRPLGCGDTPERDEKGADGPKGRGAATPGDGAADTKEGSKPVSWDEWNRQMITRPAEIDVRDLTHNRGQARSLGRTVEAVDEGNEPRFWDHWATDQRIFDREKPAGTLLVDCSGSMRWDWPTLRRNLRQLPATTVAGYSGFKGVAHLWIIARNSRWADADLSTLGPNNLIDIEALEWLCDQPEPRVWVSDGELNGGLASCIGDRKAEAMVREMCASYNIVRADSMDAALRHLRSGRRQASASARGLRDHRDADLISFRNRNPMGQWGSTMPDYTSLRGL